MSNASWSQAPPEAALTQVEALAALRDSEERFHAFITAETDVVYRMNADWSELCQLVGRNFVADVPRPTDGWLADYIYPEDQTRVPATIAEAIRTRGVFEMEHRVRRLDGSVGLTHSRAVPLLDAQGSIREWIGNAVDITEHRHKEQTLNQSQERYSGLLNSINEGYCAIEVIFDAHDTPVDFTYLEVNPAFENLTGMRDVQGRRVRELIPDVKQRWLDRYGSVALTGVPTKSRGSIVGSRFFVFDWAGRKAGKSPSCSTTLPRKKRWITRCAPQRRCTAACSMQRASGYWNSCRTTSRTGSRCTARSR